jgi:signal transduction histidine kinase
MTLLADKNALGVTTRSVTAPSAPAWADVPCAQVTRLVASTLDVPVALLSLQRAEEYRFRVNIGLDGYESVPCRISFCAYTLLGTDLLVVPDARVDDRFRQNPLVLGAPHVIAYVGAPLISSRGARLGTLCAIDRQPRTFTPAQLEQMRDLARIAAWLLESEADRTSPQATPLISDILAEADGSAERERLAIALHEGVAQDLFALRLQLQRIRDSSAWRPEADASAARAGIALTRALDRSISDVCEIANGLLARGPGRLGIVEAIHQQAEKIARRTGLEIQVHEVGVVDRIDAGTRLLLLRATREALANAAQNARVCNVNVTLECGSQVLRLRVVDDGVGPGADANSLEAQAGLAGLRERACAAGGTVHVERNTRGGTTLCLQLPRASSVNAR